MLKFILLINLIMTIMLTMMKSPISSNLIILAQTMTLTMMIIFFYMFEKLFLMN